MFEAVDFAAVGVSVAAAAGSGTRLVVRYAKESATHAGVELRLDSLENDPIHTFQLAATGGWDTFGYAETTVPPITGTHDLYVTFRLADTTGVGNSDLFWFVE